MSLHNYKQGRAIAHRISLLFHCTRSRVCRHNYRKNTKRHFVATSSLIRRWRVGAGVGVVATFASPIQTRGVFFIPICQMVCVRTDREGWGSNYHFRRLRAFSRWKSMCCIVCHSGEKWQTDETQFNDPQKWRRLLRKSSVITRQVFYAPVFASFHQVFNLAHSGIYHEFPRFLGSPGSLSIVHAWKVSSILQFVFPFPPHCWLEQVYEPTLICHFAPLMKNGCIWKLESLGSFFLSNISFLSRWSSLSYLNTNNLQAFAAGPNSRGSMGMPQPNCWGRGITTGFLPIYCLVPTVFY